MIRGVWLLLLAMASAPVAAQPPGAPEPILRAALDPPQVVVGQSVTLRIEVLAPNYVTAPPIFPDLQLHNAVTRTLGSANISEQHDGTIYAGVRREVAIHPLEPGSYAIADQQVTVTYAADPPATSQATLPLPRLAFHAVIPDTAQGLDPFISAERLTLVQQVAPTLATLNVGDAVVRTIILQGDAVPAMLLPQVTFTAPEGIAVYPNQPKLAEKTDPQTNALAATRVDGATFILEKPGQYVLPAIDIAWWNARSQRIEWARADLITLRVVANPALLQADPGDQAAETGADRRAVLATLLAHWPLFVLVVGALAGLAWAAPPAFRSARAWLAHRRSTYLASEAAAFAHLRRAVRHGPDEAYAALLKWLARFDPVAPDHTVAALRDSAGDAELDRELARLESRLFAPGRERHAQDWSPSTLLRHVAAARRRLLHRGTARATTAALAPLNPPPPRTPMRARNRPVAR